MSTSDDELGGIVHGSAVIDAARPTTDVAAEHTVLVLEALDNLDERVLSFTLS